MAPAPAHEARQYGSDQAGTYLIRLYAGDVVDEPGCRQRGVGDVAQGACRRTGSGARVHRMLCRTQDLGVCRLGVCR